MFRIGFGYDSHRFAPGRRLVLGGVEIPCAEGLLGHSDADVLLHALADAIFGAVGEGDIGQHFPDTDPANKDMSSSIIVERAVEIAAAKGYRVGNADATVILERPKIGPYRNLIAQRIAHLLNLRPEEVSIKAKTNEGMGLVGEGKGAAAFAVVSIEGKD